MFDPYRERNAKRKERRTYYERKYQHVSTKRSLDALKKWKKTRQTEAREFGKDNGRLNSRTQCITKYRFSK
jgi:hypothetical protein